MMMMIVDYCLHIAHGYHSSVEKTRKEKARQALTHLGISIVGAAVTTGGACIFLFFTDIYLFYELGIMLFANTICAVLMSLVFLASLMMICGPVHGKISKGPSSEVSPDDIAAAAAALVPVPKTKVLPTESVDNSTNQENKLWRGSAEEASDRSANSGGEKLIKV